MSKLAGCSKDHAKEIDLYNKSYEDKVERINTMLKMGKEAFDSLDNKTKEEKEELLQKASYYYA